MKFTAKTEAGEIMAMVLNSDSLVAQLGSTFLSVKEEYHLQVDGSCVPIPDFDDHCACWHDDGDACCWCEYDGDESRPCVVRAGTTRVFLPELLASIQPQQAREAQERQVRQVHANIDWKTHPYVEWRVDGEAYTIEGRDPIATIVIVQDRKRERYPEGCTANIWWIGEFQQGYFDRSSKVLHTELIAPDLAEAKRLTIQHIDMLLAWKGL